MMTPKPWRQNGNEIVGAEGTPNAKVICLLAYGHVSPAPPFSYLDPAHMQERDTVEANARAIEQVPAMVELIQAIVKLSDMNLLDMGTLALNARAILAVVEGEK